MAAALLFQLRTDSSRLAAKPNFGLTEGIMSTATIVSTMQREPELLGQAAVVIGGSGGIGLETSRRACGGEARLPSRAGIPNASSAPAEVAALTIHIMTKTALMGATYDIDGGQHFAAASLEEPE
jgi:hypothetical protein